MKHLFARLFGDPSFWIPTIIGVVFLIFGFACLHWSLLLAYIAAVLVAIILSYILVRVQGQHSKATGETDTLESIVERIRAMLDWPEDWNGYAADRISPLAAQYAIKWVTGIYEQDASLLDDVNVISDAQGGVVLEWFGSPIDKHLTLYIGESGKVEYLQDWGANINNDMDEGEVTDIDHFIQLKGALTQ